MKDPEARARKLAREKTRYPPARALPLRHRGETRKARDQRTATITHQARRRA